MYLSRVQLNLVRKGAHKLLGSPQALHAAVLSSFPQSDAERGRVLWRVDRDSNQTWLYVVSTPQPDFTHIVEQAGWPMTQGWAVRDYAPLLDSLAVGQEWEFRLTANPTHLARIGKDGPLKRMGHVTVDHQQKWLLCRCGDLGFEIPVSNGVANVVVHDRLVERFQRRSENGVTSVTIAKATFDGKMVVTDPKALKSAMTMGIGPGKAYGCGLLTLAALS